MKVCKTFKMVDELSVELLFTKTSYTKRHMLKGARVKFKNNNKKYLFFGYCPNIFCNVLSQEVVKAGLKRDKKNSCLEGLINR